MGVLRQEIRERISALQGVLKSLRTLAGIVSRVQRLIRRKVQRKTALPDEQDLIDVVNLLKEIISFGANLAKIISDLGNVFRL